MDRGEAVNSKIRGPRSGLRATNYIVHTEREKRGKKIHHMEERIRNQKGKAPKDSVRLTG